MCSIKKICTMSKNHLDNYLNSKKPIIDILTLVHKNDTECAEHNDQKHFAFGDTIATIPDAKPGEIYAHFHGEKAIYYVVINVPSKKIAWTHTIYEVSP